MTEVAHDSAEASRGGVGTRLGQKAIVSRQVCGEVPAHGRGAKGQAAHLGHRNRRVGDPVVLLVGLSLTSQPVFLRLVTSGFYC
jgi:hypothetical protein